MQRVGFRYAPARFDLLSQRSRRRRRFAGQSQSARGPGDWLHSLKDAGQPNIYPVNPNADEIDGLTAYARLTDIPGPVDHVISAIPAAYVLDMLEDASAKGVRSIHLFTAGFAETGIADRLELQQTLKSRAAKLGIRLIGPNCLGLYVPEGKVSFAQQLPTDSGPVAFFSQSGTNASDATYNGAVRGLRFSKVVSFGNAIDISASELLDYAAADPETEIIGAYIEGMQDARRILPLAAPRLVRQARRSAQGRAAAVRRARHAVAHRFARRFRRAVGCGRATGQCRARSQHAGNGRPAGWLAVRRSPVRSQARPHRGRRRHLGTGRRRR